MIIYDFRFNSRKWPVEQKPKNVVIVMLVIHVYDIIFVPFIFFIVIS